MSRGPEAALELQVRSLFTIVGGVVKVFSQGYRPDPGGTRQTPGIADLEIFFPQVRKFAKFETKTLEGLREHFKLLLLPLHQVRSSQLKHWKRAQAQAEYRALCMRTGIPYGIGGIAEAKTLLMDVGLAKQESGTVVLTPGGCASGGAG